MPGDEPPCKPRMGPDPAVTPGPDQAVMADRPGHGPGHEPRPVGAVGAGCCGACTRTTPDLIGIGLAVAATLAERPHEVARSSGKVATSFTSRPGSGAPGGASGVIGPGSTGTTTSGADMGCVWGGEPWPRSDAGPRPAVSLVSRRRRAVLLVVTGRRRPRAATGRDGPPVRA